MCDIRELDFNPEFTRGAQSAIRQCLRLTPQERITVITDHATAPIAASLVREIDAIGSEASIFLLEDCASRPLAEMPEAILEDLPKSRVSIFAARAGHGELKSRIQLCTAVNTLRIRHAHMVNISERIMLEGMRADFLEIDRLSTVLIERARAARSLKATTPAGTDIEVVFSPDLRWLKTSGIISEEKWSNLPGGEIFTAPAKVNGTFVTNGVVGDYLCGKYGNLEDHPITIEIENSRIRSLACDNARLLEEFRSYTRTDENSDRVGEFAIGTNIAVRGIIGEILQDEKCPGIHIAFGHPYAEHTGADWSSTTHIDCVGREFTIWMDGERVMSRGVFAVKYLDAARGAN
jgi:leucyl aminopeptidase (aminopeptidase T)